MKLKLLQQPGILVTNNNSNEEGVDEVSVLIVRKFNGLSDKVEKRLHNIEDQISVIQFANLS